MQAGSCTATCGSSPAQVRQAQQAQEVSMQQKTGESFGKVLAAAQGKSSCTKDGVSCAKPLAPGKEQLGNIPEDIKLQDMLQDMLQGMLQDMLPVGNLKLTFTGKEQDMLQDMLQDAGITGVLSFLNIKAYELIETAQFRNKFLDEQFADGIAKKQFIDKIINEFSRILKGMAGKQIIAAETGTISGETGLEGQKGKSDAAFAAANKVQFQDDLGGKQVIKDDLGGKQVIKDDFAQQFSLFGRLNGGAASAGNTSVHAPVHAKESEAKGWNVPVDGGEILGSIGTANNTGSGTGSLVTGQDSNVLKVSDLPGHLMQVTLAAYQKGNGSTYLQFKLYPEHLGQLTVKLSFSGGELNAHFLAANSQAKEAIEQCLAQLRDNLAQHNIYLGEASVSTGHGQDGRPDGGRFTSFKEVRWDDIYPPVAESEQQDEITVWVKRPGAGISRVDYLV